MSFPRFLASLLVAVGVASPAAAANFYISAKTVYGLQGDLSSVSPAVQTPSNAADYLDSGSALGYYGPIGPYGPLGILGPVGDNTWSPSYWISGAGSWSYWSNTLNDFDGPLSSAGPLGPNGPLSHNAYWVDLPAINDFSKQLQGGGVWTVLGPLGPLGALGPLGPLGPIGAHGYGTNSCGSYVSGGVEKRTVSVPYNGSSRTYGLYEKYTESCAKTKTNNDTSFMVDGYIAYPYSEVDSFEFTSGVNQFVTILLVPTYELDDFDLTITDATGKVIANSNTGSYIDWVQLNNVAPGTKLRAQVRHYATGHFLTKDYRLFVTGSTQYINTTDITGNHQVAR